MAAFLPNGTGMLKVICYKNLYWLILFSLLFTGACSSPDTGKKDAPHKQITPQSFHQIDSRKFNVFMIVSDALRQDALGCYGGKAKTPNIDWLAKHGALFENSYSTSPWTVPSSVSIFTGNNPTIYTTEPFGKLSVRINVPDSDLLLPEVLHSLGYQTEMMIENPNAKLHNNLQGFEHISFDKSRQFDTYFPADKRKKISQVIGEKLQNGLTYKPVYVWVDKILSLRANNSFFFLHWFLDPHSPYDPPPDFAVQVDYQKLTRPYKTYRKVLSPEEDYSAYEKAYNKKLYLAEVESVDKRVGMILKALRYKHLLNQTYIILTADHGEQFGEHGHTGHGGFGKGTNLYETLLRIPLIISGPGVKRGRRVATPVSLLGLMPTIKDMLGLSYPETMQGKSFSSLLFGGSKILNNQIYFSNVVKEGIEQSDALLFGGYKLIAHRSGNYELYDLRHDPSESDDLSSKCPQKVATMSQKIQLIRAENRQRLAENEKQNITNNTMDTTKTRSIINHLKELGYVK